MRTTAKKEVYVPTEANKPGKNRALDKPRTILTENDRIASQTNCPVPECKGHVKAGQTVCFVCSERIKILGGKGGLLQDVSMAAYARRMQIQGSEERKAYASRG